MIESSRSSENYKPFSLKNCSFWRQQQASIDEFKSTLQKGNADWQKKNSSSGLGHVFKKISSLLSSEKPIQKIFKVWNGCIEAIIEHDGEKLHKNLKSIMKERELHPVDLQATLPGMSPASITKVVEFMHASASLFLAFSALKQRSPFEAQFHLNNAVESYYHAGIREDDASLEKFESLLLKHFETLE